MPNQSRWTKIEKIQFTQDENDIMNFIHARLIEVHKENRNYGYMHQLRNIILKYGKLHDYNE